MIVLSIPEVNRRLTALYLVHLVTGKPLSCACAECAKYEAVTVRVDAHGITGIVCESCSRLHASDLDFHLLPYEMAELGLVAKALS